MSSRCRERGFVHASLALAVVLVCAPLGARELVVCADPDNLPYSRTDGIGFEYRIAQVVAEDLGADLRFQWQPLRRGVVRKTLNAQACDVLAGVPVGLERVTSTASYYRSAFVFIYRRSIAPFAGYADTRLRSLKIGVQLPGADMAATPAALALARQGILDNIVGFPVYGAEPSAQRMVEAIERGDIDVAIAWGPQAGYFVRRARVPMAMSVARGETDFEFSIAMAVRDGDTALRDELDAALLRSREKIRRILAEYDVPIVEQPVAHASSPSQ